MRKTALAAVLATLVSISAVAANLNVNCNQGESIKGALASLNKYGPNTITIRGTCTESVTIEHFDHLTIKGRNEATIVAPTNSVYAITVRESRDVMIRDLTLHGPNVAYIEGCVDCRIYTSTVEGTILVGSMSRVVVFKSTLHSIGSWTTFGIFDNSVGFMNDCVLDHGSNPEAWSAGVFVGKGAVMTIGGTTLTGFQTGITVSDGYLDLTGGYASNLPGVNADQTVLIKDSWAWAIEVSSGGVANLDSIARLDNNGETWWGGGISVVGRSTVNVGNGAEITNSMTDGIRADWGSHVSIAGGAKITGSNGNGVSLMDLSTASVGGTPQAIINGNALGWGNDIACDASSIFGGVANVSYTKADCANLK